MFEALQCHILKTIAPRPRESAAERSHGAPPPIASILGPDFLARIQGKTVLDFGCGEGGPALEMLRRGARRVVGVDIRHEVLELARRKAAEAGLQDDCLFTRAAAETVDVVVSIDSFEHFEDPAAILRIMNSLLKPSGEVLIVFGRTWLHPYGGHLFSVFPWAHLLFSEEALIRWRAGFRNDGARRFSNVSGGLNQITIGRFEEIVAQSDFRIAGLHLTPIRPLAPLHRRWTREFTTSAIRVRLVKKG